MDRHNEYSYKEILYIDESGIHFKDGKTILFEECRKNWADSKYQILADTFCVAERDICAEEPFFLFYDDERTRVVFNKTSFPFLNKNKREFLKVQAELERLGYTTYDRS
ncbi:hypothetical protein [Butyrivibrio sp. AE3009]|uniref:hypothetical protein n=1 Tax=Butyrivibrio sp. AE3009 TaxID=1280666 RepID=UPI0003B79981|nr:hypothetical protein [Butyrivibrio sp. AE3009]